MKCSCAIDVDADPCTTLSQKMVISKKDHMCCECGRYIRSGEIYEKYVTVFDGGIESYKTCVDCLSLRNAFFSSWCFGFLWEDWKENMASCLWDVPEDCISSLTPSARAKACESIENQWWMWELEGEE